MSYNNGNFTSTTIINNGISYTQNIMNLGSGCGNDSNYCNEGYSLYFPCLKDVTRGESVCFDFYIADNSTHDVADLRDVDAITIELSGRYGCVYGDYSYPDDIFSLQREEYTDVIFDDDFIGENVFELKVHPVVLPQFTKYDYYSISGKVGRYYAGEHVSLRAYDTKDKIFVGWGDASILVDDEETLCSITFDDIRIVPNSCNTFELSEDGYRLDFNMDRDLNIFAVYRDREVYSLTIDWEKSNGLAYYVSYDGELIEMTDDHNLHKSEDGDSRVDSEVKILEGHKFYITAVPYLYDDIYDDGSDIYCKGDFHRWWDGDYERKRIIRMTKDMSVFAYINENKAPDEGNSDYDFMIFSENWATYRLDNNVLEWRTIDDADNYNESVIIDGGSISYNGDCGYLNISNMSSVSVLGISDEYGIKVVVEAMRGGSDPCDLAVSCGGEHLSVEVDLKNEYSMYFRKGGVITISSSDNVHIYRITVYKEDIIDKGLCQLCLDGEETSKMGVGPIYASGVVVVGGKSYGLPITTIGNINKLKRIIL